MLGKLIGEKTSLRRDQNETNPSEVKADKIRREPWELHLDNVGIPKEIGPRLSTARARA